MSYCCLVVVVAADNTPLLLPPSLPLKPYRTAAAGVVLFELMIELEITFLVEINYSVCSKARGTLCTAISRILSTSLQRRQYAAAGQEHLSTTGNPSQHSITLAHAPAFSQHVFSRKRGDIAMYDFALPNTL